MMKTTTTATITTTVFLFLLCFCAAPCKTEHCAGGNHSVKIKSLFQFGDSFADTGNALHLYPNSWVGKPPNGITIGKPTGRFSDGLVIFDYIAKALGLDSPTPYLDITGKSTRSNGANFAVGGVTALSGDTLMKRWNISLPFANSTLDVQLQWFRRYLLRTCRRRNNNKSCVSDLLESSLMSIEIGGNDYTLLLLKDEQDILAHKKNRTFISGPIEEAKKSMLPLVIHKITSALKRMMSDGATQVFVHGLYPYGCTPGYLTRFPAVFHNLTVDKLGCIKEANDFVKYHNHHLRQGLLELQEQNREVNIIYVDIYKIMRSLLTHASSLGFAKTNVTCCGAGGKYNYVYTVFCGDYRSGVRPCKQPGKYVFWDEFHLSQAASQQIAKRMIPKILKKPYPVVCPRALSYG
ncbi:unnamed protein product [Linum trigynum]|uniref:Uncharacterized protein n=1 Tax=Linum trigynum TaxID=586398 RepID=A0AAV2F5X6_9ROSI